MQRSGNARRSVCESPLGSFFSGIFYFYFFLPQTEFSKLAGTMWLQIIARVRKTVEFTIGTAADKLSSWTVLWDVV